MNFLLMTTCILDDSTYKDLQRLVVSIKNTSNLKFQHIVLLQGKEAVKYDLSFLSNIINYSSHVIYNDFIISLSKARNIMIDYSHRFNMIRDSDVVSFPDDDCWYPKGFLDFISKEIKELDFKIVYTKYGSSPTIVSLSLDTNKHAIKNLVSFASSNTTFYNSNLFVKVGFFNEEFGVGAKYNGGEDTDFAIRSLLETSKQSIKFIDSILVGHRDPNSLFKYKYFNGSLRVLKLHSLKSVGLFYIYFRKLVVGLFFYASGKISLSDLNTK